MHRLKSRVLYSLVQLITLLFHGSYRYRVYNRQFRDEAEGKHRHKAFVIASWHQNCFAGILAHAGQGIALLASRSKDGEIVGRMAKALGLITIRGSSKKGGAEALEKLIQATHNGQRSAITIDGPKGPAFKIKRGVFALSAATGAPVLPLITVGRRSWILSRSWDRFRIPKPFTRVSVIYGQSFVVTPEELEYDLPNLELKLSRELRRLENQAELMGLGQFDTRPLETLEPVRTELPVAS